MFRVHFLRRDRTNSLPFSKKKRGNRQFQSLQSKKSISINHDQRASRFPREKNGKPGGGKNPSLYKHHPRNCYKKRRNFFSLSLSGAARILCRSERDRRWERPSHGSSEGGDTKRACSRIHRVDTVPFSATFMKVNGEPSNESQFSSFIRRRISCFAWETENPGMH